MGGVDGGGFSNFLDMLVCTHIQHSERRWHEVQRAEAQLTSLGLPASMLSASQEVFARTTRSAVQNPPPGVPTTDVTAALKWPASTSADYGVSRGSSHPLPRPHIHASFRAR